MNSLFFISGLLTFSNVYGKLFTEDIEEQKMLWETYKTDFKKSYSDEAEDSKRFGYFLKNLELADYHQQLALDHQAEIEDYARHSITEFFDRNLSEEHASMLPPLENLPAVETEAKHLRKLTTCSVRNLLFKDWTSVLCTNMKNAGTACLGSGWAFAVTSQVESDARRQHGENYNYVLSPEQLLQCVTASNGCSGGSVDDAYQYLQSYGLEQNNNYPYTSFYGTTGGPCAYNANLAVVKVGGYFTQLSGSESCMAHYVQETGPISVCVAASEAWYSYSGGIMHSSSCPANTPNHCMQAVGVKPSSTYGYWKLRGNFGSQWGEGGYIRISYNHNTCNINAYPVYTSTIVDL